MADEITVTCGLQITNGAYRENRSGIRFLDDQSAIGGNGGVVDVGTSEETMPVGDVSSEGWLMLTNLDETNYVEYGPDSTGMVVFGRLEPGQTHLLKLSPAVVVKWQANTAAVKVHMLLLER